MENYRELKDYILPERVLKAENVCGAENLIRYQSDIASFLCKHPCVVAPKGYIILDFGKEYQGGVKIIAQDMMGKKNANIRVRFGESLQTTIPCVTSVCNCRGSGVSNTE